MDLIHLNNCDGRRLAINPLMVEAVYVVFEQPNEADGENCRIRCAGVEYMVTETYQEVTDLLSV